MTDGPATEPAALQRAAENVRAAESGLKTARLEYRRAIIAAHDAGMSLSAIGRELGISRQRVKQVLEEAEG